MSACEDGDAGPDLLLAGYNRPHESARRVAYWLVSGLGLAFLIYFTVVRLHGRPCPPWALVAAPLLVVLLIGYDIWYRRTQSPSFTSPCSLTLVQRLVVWMMKRPEMPR